MRGTPQQIAFALTGQFQIQALVALVAQRRAYNVTADVEYGPGKGTRIDGWIAQYRHAELSVTTLAQFTCKVEMLQTLVAKAQRNKSGKSSRDAFMAYSDGTITVEAGPLWRDLVRRALVAKSHRATTGPLTCSKPVIVAVGEISKGVTPAWQEYARLEVGRRAHVRPDGDIPSDQKTTYGLLVAVTPLDTEWERYRLSWGDGLTPGNAIKVIEVHGVGIDPTAQPRHW